MQFILQGEMTVAEVRQALFEMITQAESENGLRFSRGATLYIHPTNGFGDAITIRDAVGHEMHKIYGKGAYRSAAAEFRL